MEQYEVGVSHSDVSATLALLRRWLAKEQEDAGDWPGLAALEPARSRGGRHGAILLPFRALLAAIEAAK